MARRKKPALQEPTLSRTDRAETEDDGAFIERLLSAPASQRLNPGEMERLRGYIARTVSEFILRAERRDGAAAKEWDKFHRLESILGNNEIAEDREEQAKLLEEAGVSEAEVGTYKAKLRLAEWRADKDLAEWRKVPRPELAELYGCIRAAFDGAVEIALWTRAENPPRTYDFVLRECQLEAHFSRYKALSDLQERWKHWPVKPAIFLWLPAESALCAAAVFAEQIRGGVACARTMVAPPSGRSSMAGLQVTPEPDPYFTVWRDESLKELLTRTMPAPPEFAPWIIRRDAQALQMKIDEEWREVLAASSLGGVIELKPSFHGMSVDLRALWPRVRRKWHELWDRHA